MELRTVMHCTEMLIRFYGFKLFGLRGILEWTTCMWLL